jgi:hypothetical protein
MWLWNKLNRGEISGEMAYFETRHFRINDAYLQSMLAIDKQFCNNGERRLGFAFSSIISNHLTWLVSSQGWGRQGEVRLGADPKQYMKNPAGACCKCRHPLQHHSLTVLTQTPL